MKMWLTKYALTKGIEEVNADLVHPEEKYATVGEFGFYRVGSDIWHSWYEAEEAAESMRLRKVASLKKSIKKMESLRFTQKEPT